MVSVHITRLEAVGFNLQGSPSATPNLALGFEASMPVSVTNLFRTLPCASYATSHGTSLRVMLLSKSRSAEHSGIANNEPFRTHAFTGL